MRKTTTLCGLVGLLILVINSCMDTAPEEKHNTPETVARYWLERYFSNDFKAAKTYSTPETQVMIDTIESVLFIDNDNAVDFKIIALHCDTKGIKSTCAYIYVEGEEKIPERVTLTQLDGQWLVDAKLLDDGEDFLDEEDVKMAKEFEDFLEKQDAKTAKEELDPIQK